MINKKRLTKIPIKKATTPFHGAKLLLNKYWIIMDDCILFYDGIAPQCNSIKNLSEMVRDKLYPDCEVKFLKEVYTPWS